MKQTSYYKRIHTDGENYWFGKQKWRSLLEHYRKIKDMDENNFNKNYGIK